jgi:hypothetical protein
MYNIGLSKEEALFVKQARDFAIKHHEETNHLYDGKPYSFHLEMVVEFALKYIHLIPEGYRHIVLAAIWLHDTVEDCRLTYNDIRKATNYQVAEIVYALSNEKGKTRAERANSKYYKGIRAIIFAVFGKLSDRLGNGKYSYEKSIGQITAGSMFDKYGAENDKFIWSLIKPEWYEIHQYLLRLLVGHKKYFEYRKMKHIYYPMIQELDSILNKE